MGQHKNAAIIAILLFMFVAVLVPATRASTATTNRATASLYRPSSVATVGMTVSFQVVGGGTPAAPVFSYVQNGTAENYTLTMAPAELALDEGTQWFVSPNPLLGSGASERWYSSQAMSGTASAATMVFAFRHQYMLTEVHSSSSPSSTGNTLINQLGLNAPYLYAQRFTQLAPGTVTSISVYTMVLPGAEVGVALYSDAAGAPGVQLTATQTVKTACMNCHVTVSLAPPNQIQLTAGTSYWLVFEFDHDGAATYTGQGGSRCYLAGWLFGTVLPNPWPGGSSCDGGYEAQVYWTVISTTTIGSVNPESGWQDSGADVQVRVGSDSSSNSSTANYRYSSVSGSGSGSYTGSSNPFTVTMNGPINETVNWAARFVVVVSLNGRGAVTPGNGTWYAAGAVQQFTISSGTTNSSTTRDVYVGVTGSGVGAYSGPNRVFTVTVNSTITESVMWQTQSNITFTGVGLNGNSSATVLSVNSFGPKIYLGSGSVAQDSILEVMGVGFTPNSQVGVYFQVDHGDLALAATTDSSGAFALQFGVGTTYAGQHTVTAIDPSTGATTVGWVTVSQAVTQCGQSPSLLVNSTSQLSVSQNQHVSIEGSGFCADAYVTISGLGSQPLQQYADQSGGLSMDVLVGASVPVGENDAYATDGTSGISSNTVKLLVSQTGSFNFSVSNTGGVTVEQGWNGSTTVTATLTNGTGQAVVLSCAAGLPSGASCLFTAARGTPTFTTPLQISVQKTTATGHYTIVVQGVDAPTGKIARTSTLTLTIIQRITPISCKTLPVELYDSGTWEWWISDPTACTAYLSNQGSIDAFRPYPDLIVNWLNTNMPTGRMPQKLQIYIEQPGTGIVYSTGDSIHIPADAFYDSVNGYRAFWAYALISQETMNIYTGSAVSSGWPTDWWADSRSPFPLVTGMMDCMAVNWGQSRVSCQLDLTSHEFDPLVHLFEMLYQTYGPGTFQRMFAAADADNIDWTLLGNNPSALRTNYVAAYLTIGAGSDLTPLMNGVVPNYNQQMIADIIQARTRLQSISKLDPGWTMYLNGEFTSSLTGGTTAYTAKQLPASSFYTVGSTISYTFYADPATPGARYACASVAGLGQTRCAAKATVASPGTITATYIAQYFLTVTSSSGGSTTAKPTTATGDINPENAGALAQGYMYGQMFVQNQTARLQSISFYALSDTEVSVALYSHDALNDKPLQMLTKNYTVTVACAPCSVTVPMNAGDQIYLSEGTAYWVAFKIFGDGGVSYIGGTGGRRSYVPNAAWGAAWPSTWPAESLQDSGYQAVVYWNAFGWEDAGANVVLTAVPDSGYTFLGWAGSGAGNYTGKANPATATMNSPITETATFQSLTIHVTITSSPAGSGYVAVDGVAITTPHNFTWAFNSTHTLTATGKLGCGAGCQYEWNNWSDGGSATHKILATQSQYRATFKKEWSITLNYAVYGGGLPAAPNLNYVRNGVSQSVPLSRTSFTAYWVDDASTLSITPNPLAGSTSTERWYSCQSTYTASKSTTLTVTFYNQFLQTLSYFVTGGGSGYGAPSFTARQCGTTTSMALSTTATAYWFDYASSWAVTNPLTGSGKSERWETAQSVSGTVKSTLLASFGYQHQYQITVSVSPSYGGTASPTTSWQSASAQVAVTATPSKGYVFSNWAGTGTGSYSGTANPATITVNGPVTEIGYFAPTSSITITSSPTGAGFIVVDGSNVTTPWTFTWLVGSVHTLSANSPVTYKGKAYAFVSWSDRGAQTHTITVPYGKATYAASYLSKPSVSISTLRDEVIADYNAQNITSLGVEKVLVQKIDMAQRDLSSENSGRAKTDLQMFIQLVKTQRGRTINAAAADQLVTDAEAVMSAM